MGLNFVGGFCGLSRIRGAQAVVCAALRPWEKFAARGAGIYTEISGFRPFFAA